MQTMKRRKAAGGRIGFVLIVTALFLFLTMPLAATFLFSISTVWQNTILPEGYTLENYVRLFTDERFMLAMGRSLLVSAITVAVTLVVMVPTIFVIALYFPRLEKWLQSIVLLPFALPGVVAAVGLIRIYSSGPVAISGTIWILIGVYFIVIMPYVYQSVRNSLRAINAAELMEAAEVLGAGKLRAFLRVVVPNIMPGIMVASLLSFSILLGEFVLANMLVGGSYEVVQVYLFRMLGTDGHASSATIMTFFLLVALLYLIIIKISNWKPHAASAGDEEAHHS